MRQLHPNSRQVAWLLALRHGLVSTDSRQWACTRKPSRASRCRASGLKPKPYTPPGFWLRIRVRRWRGRTKKIHHPAGRARRRSASLVARCRSSLGVTRRARRRSPVGVTRRLSAALGVTRRSALGVARRSAPLGAKDFTMSLPTHSSISG